MSIDYFMTNLSNLVNEDHYVSLENLSSISKVSDITKTINSKYFDSRDDDVYKIGIFNNSGDNLCSCLSESNS